MLMFNPEERFKNSPAPPDLNTSHVNVQFSNFSSFPFQDFYLNTSHVNVQC